MIRWWFFHTEVVSGNRLKRGRMDFVHLASHFREKTLSNQILQSQLLEVGECNDRWIMHELNMLPLITVTAVHTHTPPLFSSDPRTSGVKKRGNQALPKHFTFFSMLTSSWLAEILHSVHSYLEMQRHWLHFTRLFKTRFSAISHQTHAGEWRMYTHTDARYVTHLPLCTLQEEEGAGKALKWTRNSALFFSSSGFAVVETYFTILHMNAAFICVFCHVSALQL